jgi:ELWxxDGT repeat protein
MKKLFTISLTLFFLTINGQSFVKDFYNVSQLIEVNSQTFFVASNQTYGEDLWKTDGTKENTFLVKDINKIGSSEVTNLTSFNNELYFSANDGFFGQELWKTDGTEAGTVMIKNIQKAFGQGSYPSNFTIFNNELYFTATDYYINGNFQLWKTDGTETGTIKVYDAGGTKITDLLVANNKLYLKKGGLAEYNVFTNTVTSITVDNEYPVISELNSFDNGLYFITTINYSGQNIRLYRLDDAGNVILLQEFTQPQYGDIDLYNLTQIGSEVYFSITTDFNSGDDSDVLWKTDGTNKGTSIIKSFDWTRYLSGSNISNFIEYKNELYFNAGSQNNYTLWKSDGTDTGTEQAVNLSISNSLDFIPLNNLLYFSNYNTLWSTDGSDLNTKKYSDLIIDSKTSDDLFNVKVANNTLFFEAEYQDKSALYTIEPNPIIGIKNGNLNIEINSISSFESKIDSVVHKIIKVKNVGNKNLVFSKIKVTGQDFYIDGQQLSNISDQNPNGNFYQILEPGTQSEFELSFYPSSKGLKKGTLSILSNDIITPNFNIELNGFAENEIVQNLNENISLDKEIIFDSSSSLINIDNNLLQEDTPLNTIVGILNVPNNNEDYTYKLVFNEENIDNQYFYITNNELITNNTFDFEQKNTFQLKISATNNITNKIIEASIIISITNITEDIVLEECLSEIKNLGFGLNDVAFIDDKNVITVGTHGVILKSENGGNDWRKIRSDINNHLNNVQFTTNKIGYAIGDNLLKTEDAGESWFKLKLPDESYPIPTNIHFVNSEIGFVFGNDGKIFKTSNGGRYWKQIKFSYNNLNSAFFLNESKGFIVGSSKTLIKTLDGGKNWESINLEIDDLYYSLNFTNIYFVSDLIGFISSSRGDIIKTTDGGNTWFLVSQLEHTLDIKDLFFKDNNIGYALTENYLYKTINGGETWNNENIEYYYSGLHSIIFNNDGSKSCLVGNGTSCCTGYSTGHIIYTKELENDWVNTSYLSLRSSALNTIYMNQNIGFVFGNDYGAKTLDGGITWKNLTPPESDIFQIEVINSTVYLLGRNNIYKSTDSGETWDILSTSNYFNKLHFINEQVIYAISSEYGVYKTIDGGINWININQEPSFTYNSFFLSEQKGFMTGYDVIYKTIDGGNTWSKPNIESMQNEEATVIHSINFLDNNLGIAGSSTGLLKTIDGGENWFRINKNMGGTVKFIKMINEIEWFAITDNRVLKTTDAGLTWKSIYNGNDISNVYRSNEKLYLVGYRTFLEIGTESIPSNLGNIDGNLTVSSQSMEEYSVYKDENVHYEWAVSGDNEINYTKNKAEILWKSVGTHTVTVTPFNNCGYGTSKEIIVTIEEDWSAPIITGEIEVDEFSLNNEYLTPLSDGSRYEWFVIGSVAYNKNVNNLSINWGKYGPGEIEVIETKINTGKRKKGYLDVTINKHTLSIEDDEIEERINAFPNPTNGTFEIALPNSLNEVKITIFSTNSQIVSTKMYPVVDDKVIININNLPVGMYFIKVNLESPTSFKIIKN